MCSVGGGPPEFGTGFGTLERRANHGDAVFAAGERELPGSPQAGDDLATVHPEQRFLLPALPLLLFEPTEFGTGLGTFDCRAAHDDALRPAHETVPGIREALGDDAAIPRTQSFLFFGLATPFLGLPALCFLGLPALCLFGLTTLLLGLRALRLFGLTTLLLGLRALRLFGLATLFLGLRGLCFAGLPALRFLGLATPFLGLPA